MWDTGYINVSSLDEFNIISNFQKNKDANGFLNYLKEHNH
jgi:hypothetical protein